MKTYAFCIAAVALFLWMDGYHIRHKPTPDELYGCTIAQRAPNGECK